MTYGKKKDRAMAMCFRNALFRGRLEAGENGCFVGFLLGKSKKDGLPSKNRNISYIYVGIKNSIAWQISL